MIVTNLRFLNVMTLLFSIGLYFNLVEFRLIEIDSSTISSSYVAVIVLFLFSILIFISRLENFSKLFFSYFLFFVFFAISYLLFFTNIEFRSVLAIFPIAAFFSGVVIASFISEEDREKCYMMVGVGVLISISVRNILYYDLLSIIYSRTAIFNGYNNPYIAAGGGNLEATFIAIAAILNRRNFLFLPIFCLLTFSSLAFMSRVGLVGVGFALVSYFLLPDRRRSKYILVLILVAGAVAIWDQLESVFTRFSLRQDFLDFESGAGRLSLWTDTVSAMLIKPFGVGVGQSVLFLNDKFLLGYREDNIHNIYLTYILEMGFFVGGGVVLLIAYLCWNAARSNVNEKWVWFFLCAIGFVEMNGYNTYFWLFAGIVSCDLSARKGYREFSNSATDTGGVKSRYLR